MNSYILGFNTFIKMANAVADVQTPPDTTGITNTTTGVSPTMPNTSTPSVNPTSPTVTAGPTPTPTPNLSTTPAPTTTPTITSGIAGFNPENLHKAYTTHHNNLIADGKDTSNFLQRLLYGFSSMTGGEYAQGVNRKAFNRTFKDPMTAYISSQLVPHMEKFKKLQDTPAMLRRLLPYSPNEEHKLAQRLLNNLAGLENGWQTKSPGSEQLQKFRDGWNKVINADTDQIQQRITNDVWEKIYPMFSDATSSISFNDKLNYLFKGEIPLEPFQMVQTENSDLQKKIDTLQSSIKDNFHTYI